jgi:putative transposase
VKFRFVQENRETFRVGQMCMMLQVSRSGFYTWLRRPPSDREQSDAALIERIRLVHSQNRRAYGSPRIYNALRQDGHRAGRHRIARLMRLEGLRGGAAKRFRFTSTKHQDLPAAPNLLDRNFQSPAPNRVWAADITQVRTHEGWLYLAVVLDLFSRRCVGWATSPRPDQRLSIEAIRNAITTRRPAPGLLHHSDRGGQYLSADYQDFLDRHGIVCSMSRPGNCLDNAVVESFFHSIKTEWLYHHRFRTRAHARLYIFDYIEGFYNRTRLHSTLGYRSPIDYETVTSAA